MMTNYMINVIDALKPYYANAEKAENVILNVSISAAEITDQLCFFKFTQFNVLKTEVTCYGNVKMMFGAICNQLNIIMEEDKINTLAHTALKHIVSECGRHMHSYFEQKMPRRIKFPIAVSVLPFTVIYLAGYLFLHMILELAQTHNELYMVSNAKESDMKNMITSVSISHQMADDACKIWLREVWGLRSLLL